jgi:RNA methyltransferase, TrmH family
MMKKTVRTRPPAASKDEKALDRIAGFAAVSALFAAAPDRVERLFFEERAKARVKPFCVVMARARKPYRLVTAPELERIAGTPMHGGIVAVARPRPVLPFNGDEARAWAREGHLLLLLDGIGNPHNLGAIVRTAAFFGVARAVLSDDPSQANPSDAAYRVAEGGFEHVQFYRATRFAAALKQLGQNYRVVGTAPEAKTTLATLRRSDKPFALVLGNEEAGLSRATLNACDEVISIPRAGPIQSLNVAATAAILMFALTQTG